MKGKIKNQKGITLIALIITIIILLILAMVSIRLVIHDGIIGKAKDAVNQYAKAQNEELKFIAMTKAATHNEEWIYEIGEEKIPIPAGFTPTEIEGENTLEEGLVITDAEGNEFVWIPCTSSAYEIATFKNNTDWFEFQNCYIDGNWTDEQVETIGKVSLEKLEKRKNAGELTNQGVGFYVARYEAGIPENAPFFASNEGDLYQLASGEKGKNTTVNENNEQYKPVSKKGYPAWNFISQKNAKIVSENMYKGTSYLIDSHAWNYICKSILQDKAKKEISNCSNWGNYVNNTKTKYENLNVLYAVYNYDTIHTNETIYHKGIIPANIVTERTGTTNLIELCTGASEDFKAYNIYDMAGNMWEWTTETGTNSKGQTRTSYSAWRRYSPKW